jgi:integration host factor subunit alpha
VNKINLTKNEIIKNLSIKTGFSVQLSKKIITNLLNILSLIIKNNALKLKGIGSFKLIKKKERIGRNPKTRKEYIISARNSVSFISSKKLLNLLNKNK